MRSAAVSICLFALLAIALQTAAAQSTSYKELKLASNEPNKMRAARAVKDGVLRGQLPLDANKGKMLDYYKLYLFPAMTQHARRGQLDRMADEVIQDLTRARDPAARSAAYELIFKYCNGIASGKKFRPATRYNAMLILGQLNQDEGSDGPPKPDVRAMRTLLGAMTANDDHPILKFAAIQGIIRHAEISGPANSPYAYIAKHRKAIAARLIPILQSQEMPAGVDADAHVWLQSRTVEALGHLRYSGDPDVARALLTLAGDTSANLDLRCDAAVALGRLAGVLEHSQGEQALNNTVKLSIDSCNAQMRDLLALVDSRTVREQRAGSIAERLPDLSNGEEDRRRGPLTEEDVADTRTIATRRRSLYLMIALRSVFEGDARKGMEGLAKFDALRVESASEIFDNLIAEIQDVETNIQDFGAVFLSARNQLASLLPDEPADEPADQATAGN